MSNYKKAGYLMLTLTILHIVVSSIIAMFGELNVTTGLIVNSLMITLLCIGVPAFLFIKTAKSGEKGEFYLAKPSLLQIILAFVFGIIIFYALAHLNTAFQMLIELTGADLEKLGGLDLPNLQNPLNLVIAIITVAVVPAIAEELFYRSALLYSWRSMKKTAVCLFTAFLFTLMHSSVLTFPSLFLLGYFLASITFETKSIIPAMIIHFMNNFMSLLYSINPTDSTIANVWEEITSHSIYGFVFLAAGIIAHIIIKKVARKAQARQEQETQTEQAEKQDEKTNFPHIPIAISIGIYLVFAITAFKFLYS